MCEEAASHSKVAVNRRHSLLIDANGTFTVCVCVVKNYGKQKAFTAI